MLLASSSSPPRVKTAEWRTWTRLNIALLRDGSDTEPEGAVMHRAARTGMKNDFFFGAEEQQKNHSAVDLRTLRTVVWD